MYISQTQLKCFTKPSNELLSLLDDILILAFLNILKKHLKIIKTTKSKQHGGSPVLPQSYFNGMQDPSYTTEINAGYSSVDTTSDYLRPVIKQTFEPVLLGGGATNKCFIVLSKTAVLKITRKLHKQFLGVFKEVKKINLTVTNIFKLFSSNKDKIELLLQSLLKSSKGDIKLIKLFIQEKKKFSLFKKTL